MRVVQRMNSRERILKACNFEEADRVPIDIGGSQVSGICIDHYCDMLRYLHIEETPKVYEQFEMLARVEEPVRRRLHSDVISLENPSMRWGLHNRDWKPWRTFQGNDVLMPGDFNPQPDPNGGLVLKDQSGRPVAFMAKGTLYFEYACGTAMSDEIIKTDPQKYKAGIPLYTDEELDQIAGQAQNLHDNTEYAVFGEFCRGGLGTNGLFAGHTITDWLCILMTERAYADEILQATVERALENLKLYIQAVGDKVDIILISGTDFGTQRIELFDPQIWRESYQPRYKVLNDYVHQHSMMKTFIHSCGSVDQIIGAMIGSGFDILNPVQVSAANMDAARLKREFGGKIVFWGGGVDTQTVLPFGTCEEVVMQVRERLEIFAPGGGFVFNPVHCIQFGVPPENLVAAADTAYAFGTYPIRLAASELV
jgi:uroporphyrinogen decarboxylase